MNKRSPVAVFIAASALLTANTLHADLSQAGGKSKLGGLKEWTTDQPIDAESSLDKEAKEAKKKAKKENICIPVGEGENCW